MGIGSFVDKVADGFEAVADWVVATAEDVFVAPALPVIGGSRDFIPPSIGPGLPFVPGVPFVPGFPYFPDLPPNTFIPAAPGGTTPPPSTAEGEVTGAKVSHDGTETSFGGELAAELNLLLSSGRNQEAGDLLAREFSLPSGADGVDIQMNADGSASITLVYETVEFDFSGFSYVDQEEYSFEVDFTYAPAETDATGAEDTTNGANTVDVNGEIDGKTGDELHADARAESVYDLTTALLSAFDDGVPQDMTDAEFAEFTLGFAGFGALTGTPEWQTFAVQMSDPHWSGSVSDLDFTVLEPLLDGQSTDGLAVLVDEALTLGVIVEGIKTEVTASGQFEHTADSFETLYAETPPPAAVTLERRRLSILTYGTTIFGSLSEGSSAFAAAGGLIAAGPALVGALLVHELKDGSEVHQKYSIESAQTVVLKEPKPNTAGANYADNQVSATVQESLLNGDVDGAVDYLYQLEESGTPTHVLETMIQSLPDAQKQQITTNIYDRVVAETGETTDYFQVLADGHSFSALEEFVFDDNPNLRGGLEGLSYAPSSVDSPTTGTLVLAAEVAARLESLPAENGAQLLELWVDSITDPEAGTQQFYYGPSTSQSEKVDFVQETLASLQAGDAELFNDLAVHLQELGPESFAKLLDAFDLAGHSELVGDLLEVLSPAARVQAFKDLTGVTDVAELTSVLTNGNHSIFNAMNGLSKGNTVRYLQGQELANNNADTFVSLDTPQERAEFILTFASGLGGGRGSVQAYSQAALLRLLPPDEAQDILSLLDATTASQIIGTLSEFGTEVSLTSTDGKEISIWTPQDQDSGWKPILLIDGEIAEPKEIILGNYAADEDPIMIFLLDPQDGHGETIEIEIDASGQTQSPQNAEKIDEFIYHYRDLGKVSDNGIEQDATSGGAFIRPITSIPAQAPQPGHVTQRTFYEDGSVVDTTRRLDAGRASPSGFAAATIYVPSASGNDTFVAANLVDVNSGTGNDPSFAVTNGGTVVSQTLLDSRRKVYDVVVKLDDGRTKTVRVSLGGNASLPDSKLIYVSANVLDVDRVQNDVSDDIHVDKARVSRVQIPDEKGDLQDATRVRITFDNGEKIVVDVSDTALEAVGGDAKKAATAYAENIGQLPPAARAAFLNKDVKHSVRAIAGAPGALAAVETDANDVNKVRGVIIPPKYLASLMSEKPNEIQQNFQSVFIHELGHLIDNPVGQDWADAMTRDATSPSGYGQAHYLEDFAETFALWYRIKTGAITGSAAENISSYLSNRFAILDNWAPALAALPESARPAA